MKKFLHPTMLPFVIVGIINTLFGTGIMFFCSEVLSQGYWVSSGANYFFGSILSFFLNKHFTFRSEEKGLKVVLRFTLNILVCWLLAYGMAEPMMLYMLKNTTISTKRQEQCALLLGMVLFVVLNYFGQRFFAFAEKGKKEDYE
ncbi:MAG: GtrA family protein [Eubacteriales bacterium]